MSLFSAHWLSRLEPWVFGVLVLLQAVPVLVFPWFPTLDGAAHLYNARIIGSLLGCDPGTARFFELDPFPEPNWLGHAIMAAGMGICSAQTAEKGVMLLYVIGLPVSFRFALRRLGNPHPWTALLILPFIYCFTFRIGFLNFSLGLPLLFFALGIGAAGPPSPPARTIAWSCVLLTVLYFAHLTCFLLAVALLLSMALRRSIDQRRTSAAPLWRVYMAHAKAPLLAATPGLLLCAAFFLSHQDERAELRHLPFAELFSGLLNGNPFVALGPTEAPYARTIAWSMAAITVVVLFRGTGRSAAAPLRGGWIGISALIVLIAYFSLPDQMATGGFISARLLLFFYLLWALWLGLQTLPSGVMACLLMATTSADLFLVRIHYDHTKGLNAELAEIMSLAPSVPRDAVILPLNYSGNWLHSNFPCYLGATRTAHVLDNFGARTPHMPVRWKNGLDPTEAVGTFATSDRPCVELDSRTEAGALLIDHVVTWKLNDAIDDSCTRDVRAQLHRSFVEVAVSPLGDARLYRRR